MENWNNQEIKENTMSDMVDLLNSLECKLALLDAMDRDITANDCMDLSDQLTTMTHNMSCLTAAVERARKVNGVDAKYDMFGEEFCS